LAGFESLRQYLDINWGPNITLEDFEWLVELSKQQEEAEADVAHDSLQLADNFYDENGQHKPMNAKFLYDYVGPFFKNMANALKQLRGRIVVEVVVADLAEVIERLRFDLVEH
jgi:hypothetical protein